MKMTVVPAQVTTVEDRIIGNLGFSQILLLIVPVFAAAGIFLLLPPFMGGALYKYVIMGIVALLFGLLSIRIKGKISNQGCIRLIFIGIIQFPSC